MRQLSEGKDYEFIVPEDKGTTIHIRIKEGVYKDTKYQYGKVAFDEQSDGAVYLKFIYNIVESNSNKEELEKDEDFKNYIGDILVNIMSQNLDKGIIDEAGTSYFEESNKE